MATPVLNESPHNANGGGAAIINVAAGAAIDDVVLLFVGWGANSLANTLTPTATPTISWTGVDVDPLNELPSGGGSLRCYWGKLTSAGAHTITCPSNGGYNTLASGHVLRGADTTNPIDAADITTITVSTTSPQSPSIDPLTADGRLFCAALSGDAASSTYNDQPAGMTDHGSDSQFGTLATASVALSASGPTGPKTWGFGNSRRWLVASVVVIGAGGKLVVLDLITETGTAQAVGRFKNRGLTVVTETGTAQALTGRKLRSLPLVSEAGSVQALSGSKNRSLPLVSETGTVIDLAGGRKLRALPLIGEIGTVLPLVSSQQTATGTPDVIYARPGTAVYRRAISVPYSRTGTLVYRRQ